MRQVFVDTSGFYAFLDDSDPFHIQARDLFLRAEKESWALLTTNYVVHEAWAVIQARLGWDAVEAWQDRVLSRCEIAWVGRDMHTQGAQRCRDARERRLSLTDCISLEFMRNRRLEEAIAQDEHFTRAGIRMPA